MRSVTVPVSYFEIFRNIRGSLLRTKLFHHAMMENAFPSDRDNRGVNRALHDLV